MIEPGANRQEKWKWVKDKLSKFTSSLTTTARKHQEGLFGLVVGLITLGLERLLDEEFFKCPKSGYQMYGIAFFVVPGVLLLFLNLLTVPAVGNIYVWTLGESCFIGAYRRYGDFFSGCISALLMGFVAPVVWVFMALISGRHLVCWELGYQFGDNVTRGYLDERGFAYMNISRYEHKVHHAKGKSHAIAAIVLGFAVSFMAIFIIARRFLMKPFKVKDRLPGLWQLERGEALAAAAEVRRLLKDDGDEEVFIKMSCLIQLLIVAEQIKVLQHQKENLSKENNDDKKKDEKIKEIELELQEFEKLKDVIKIWNEYQNLKTTKKHTSDGSDSSEIDEKIKETEKKCTDAKALLDEKRGQRVKNAKEILKQLYQNEEPKDLEEINYQSWLKNRLEEQNYYFDVVKHMEKWQDSKEELKKLCSHFEAYLHDDYTDSPEFRGRTVAAYIMRLFRDQNKYCRTPEQVIEKFQNIYPRAVSGKPWERYLDDDDYMYRFVLDTVPMTGVHGKKWGDDEEEAWRDHLERKRQERPEKPASGGVYTRIPTK